MKLADSLQLVELLTYDWVTPGQDIFKILCVYLSYKTLQFICLVTPVNRKAPSEAAPPCVHRLAGEFDRLCFRTTVCTQGRGSYSMKLNWVCNRQKKTYPG